MPIKLSQCRDKELTVLECTGGMNFIETIDVLKSFLQSPTKSCMWDMSDVAGSRWSLDEIERICRFSAAHGTSHTEGKTAFAAPSDLDFGISRMYQAFAQINKLPWQVRTFRSRHEALQWLSGGE